MKSKLLLPTVALGTALAALPLSVRIDFPPSVTDPSALAQGRGNGGDDDRGRGGGNDRDDDRGRGNDEDRGRGNDDRGPGNDNGNRGGGNDNRGAGNDNRGPGGNAANEMRGPKGEKFLGNEPRDDGFRNHGDRVSTYVAIARALGLDANVGALQANFGTPQERGVTPVNGADNWEVANLDVNRDGKVNQLDLTAAQQQRPPQPAR